MTLANNIILYGVTFEQTNPSRRVQLLYLNWCKLREEGRKKNKKKRDAAGIFFPRVAIKTSKSHKFQSGYNF